MPEVCLILDNIRSVHNVGSIFRTADTIGVSKIYCIGTTPVPIDRFNRKRKDFTKVSLGAEDSVKWEHVRDGAELLMALGQDGYYVIALEQEDNSIDYKEVSIENRPKVAIVVGNEVEGVSESLLDLADVIAEIPMKGEKESLNVSVATGILLYRLID
jgi:23S rRNA (guanosine2251-2'-O)-methyltransferase